jgi:hypothetical protein
VTLAFHVLWMSCALAAAVFAAAGLQSWRSCLVAAAGFAAAAAWASPARLPDPAWLGVLVAAGAVAQATRAMPRLSSALLAGVLAGFWSRLLTVQGLPLAASLVGAALLIVLAAWMARTRPAFVPPRIRDEALLLLIGLGLVTAILPAILDGWQAAGNLSLASTDVPAAAMPGWIVLIGGVSLACGAGYSLWSRR